ncbi:MAG TPA: hypothetical protein VGP94_00695 [Tepidisphaeraceae bacterium]|nr:hypothetical protein [Tepidisphaeraceae bacterium]
MNSATPASWIFILFLMLIVFGALAAIIWRSWLVGGIVLVFVLLIGGLVFTYRVAAVPSMSPPMATIVSEELSSTADIWKLEPDQVASADVFPSLHAAVSGLATRLVNDIRQRDRNRNITYFSCSGDLGTESEALIATVMEAFPEAKLGELTRERAATDSAALAIVARIQGTEPTRTLRLTATSGTIVFNQSANIQNKPWVYDLNSFAEANPGHNYILGRSSTPALSAEDARRQARRAAAREIAPLVIAGYPQLSVTPPHGDHQWIIRHLENQLELGKFNRKEFVQRLNLLNSGQSYRAAVLVDASPENLRQVQSTISKEYSSSSRRVRHVGLGTVGMGLVICLVYLFLNWATRGYFQMSLRLAAFLMLIAGVLVIVMIT